MTNSLACFKTGFSLSQDYINGDVRFEYFGLIQLHLIPWKIKPCCSSSQDQVMSEMSLVFINKRNCKVIQVKITVIRKIEILNLISMFCSLRYNYVLGVNHGIILCCGNILSNGEIGSFSALVVVII